jgi:hypothetical protein
VYSKRILIKHIHIPGDGKLSGHFVKFKRFRHNDLFLRLWLTGDQINIIMIAFKMKK